MQFLKTKKFIFSLVAFVLLAGGVAAGVVLVKRNQEFREAAAPATNLRFSPSSQSKYPGDSFDLTVQINTGAGTGANSVTGYQIEISFDPAVFEATGVQKGAFVAPLTETFASGNKIDNSGGKILANAYTLDTGSALKGEGELLRVAGKVKSGVAAGQYNFEFTGGTEVVGAGEQGANVLVGKPSGQIIVLAGGGASPSPAVSPAPSPSPGVGSLASPSPSPSASPRTSPSPGSSPSPASGGAPAASPSPSPSPSSQASGGGTGGATSKPTVSLPANKTVVAGDVLTGTAKANSTVTITVQSDPITATVKADASGKWTYTLPTTLAAGTHTLTVTDANGSYTTTFTVSGTKGGVANPSGQTPEAGFGLPTYFALGAGFMLVIFGALLAF